MTLALAIHQNTDGMFFPVRLGRSLAAIAKEKGCGTAAMIVSAMAVSTIYSGVLSYFCIEGSIRSILSMREKDPLEKLTPLGNVGGWTAIAIFSSVALRSLYVQVVYEGETLRIRSICQEWIRSHPGNQYELYESIPGIINASVAQTILPRRVSDRTLSALDIQAECALEQFTDLDRRTVRVLRDIHAELKGISHFRGYCTRSAAGIKIQWQKGVKGWGALVVGIALPAILCATAALSWLGNLGLGKALFIDKKELDETGHFGEWLSNAVENFGAAFLLHQWTILSEGDFSLTKEIYARHLARIDSPVIHNRISAIAVSELSEIATRCYASKFPTEMSFDA